MRPIPQLGCLEMIQGHPCQPQRRDRLLKLDREFEELLLYFYTFISLHFQQAGTAHLQNHLGKQKNGYFHKKLFPGEEAGGYPLPGVTNGWFLGKTSPQRCLLGRCLLGPCVFLKNNLLHFYFKILKLGDFSLKPRLTSFSEELGDGVTM